MYFAPLPWKHTDFKQQTSVNGMLHMRDFLRTECSTTNSLTALSAPVDIYADWIDACDQVAKDNAADGPGQPSQKPFETAPAPAARPQAQQEYEGDFVVNDEVGMEDDYGDE